MFVYALMLVLVLTLRQSVSGTAVEVTPRLHDTNGTRGSLLSGLFSLMNNFTRLQRGQRRLNTMAFLEST